MLKQELPPFCFYSSVSKNKKDIDYFKSKIPLVITLDTSVAAAAHEMYDQRTKITGRKKVSHLSTPFLSKPHRTFNRGISNSRDLNWGRQQKKSQKFVHAFSL